jgi:hypothetical protein
MAVLVLILWLLNQCCEQVGETWDLDGFGVVQLSGDGQFWGGGSVLILGCGLLGFAGGDRGGGGRGGILCR